MSTHIDQLHAILEQLSTYTLIISKIQMGTSGVFIQPSSEIFSTGVLNEIEFFDVWIIENTAALFATKKTKLLKAKTNNAFDYNDFDARGYITVSDGTDFAVDDAIVGTTSGATGTVYKIDSNTLYLKTITGTWEVEAITGKTATCLSVATSIQFPHYLENKLVSFVRPVDFDVSVGAKFACWIRFEARWQL